MFSVTQCAVAYLIRASVWTVVQQMRYVLYGARYDTLPMPHGSSLFQRGETMSLSTCTLGTKMDEKMVDNVLEKSYQRFLLHYNFPPFCTGEAKAQRGVGRREIGHGHLAWRGLKGSDSC